MQSAFQIFSSIISILSNSILLLLICYKSPKKLGSYKYLMMFFTIHSMFFSLMEVTTRVHVLSYGTCFLVFMNRQGSIFPYEIDMMFLCIICGCCGVTMYISAIHFIFRYWAIERKGRLRYFKGYRLIFWLMIPILIGFIWGISVYLGLSVDETTVAYMRSSMKMGYGYEMEDLVLVGAFYYSPNKIVFYRNLAGMLVVALIMTSSAIIIIYCGVRIFRKIRKLHKKGSARVTKRLQTQLYKALVVQTILPVSLVFFPLALFFFLPLLHIDIGMYSQIANFTVAIYPTLEPLPLLIIIDDYRNGFCRFLHIETIIVKKPRVRLSQIQPEIPTISGTTN